MIKSSVPALLRQQVDRWAQAWLTATFSRLLELRARNPGPFNYPIEVFSEWRGKAFYLNVRYRARSRKVENEYRGLTAAECFREIEENEVFWPTT